MEIHYFGYPGAAHETVYSKATPCRCFPLTRHGDKFSKNELDALLSQYVWNALEEKARDHAEVVSIEGDDYPEDPRAYLLLVRFSRGMVVRRVALGVRLFASQYGLRESLLAYLNDVPAHRVLARSTATGVAITVKPERPAIFTPDWPSDELEFRVNLAWHMPDGTLALAPWRKTSREKFITAVGSRNWLDMQLEWMPLRFFSQDDADEDAGPPLFEVDPSLSAESLAAIDARDDPSLF